MISLILKLVESMASEDGFIYKDNYILVMSDPARYELEKELIEITKGIVTELPTKVFGFDHKICNNNGFVVELKYK